MCLSTKILRTIGLDGLVLYGWQYTFSTSSTSIFTLWVCLGLVLAELSYRDCAAWMVVCVCVYCTENFTLRCWNTPLFTPAGQRLQSMPSTETHTYTHPLCPLTFDTHSLHTLPSNATGGVRPSFFSSQERTEDRRVEPISDDQRSWDCRQDV